MSGPYSAEVIDLRAENALTLRFRLELGAEAGLLPSYSAELALNQRDCLPNGHMADEMRGR